MNLGLACEPVAAGPGKRLKASEAIPSTTSELESLTQVVVDIAKLSLSSQQEVRAIKSAIMEVIRISSDGPLASTINEVIKNFTNRAKLIQQSKDGDVEQRVWDELGAPHLHVFNAAISSTIQQLKKIIEEKKLKDEDLVTVAAHLEKINAIVATIDKLPDMSTRWTTIASEIKHARVRKAFDKKHSKLEIRIEDKTGMGQLWTIVKWVLQKSDKNFKVLQGVAPAGILECQVQAWLTERGCSSATQDQ